MLYGPIVQDVLGRQSSCLAFPFRRPVGVGELFDPSPAAEDAVGCSTLAEDEDDMCSHEDEGAELGAHDRAEESEQHDGKMCHEGDPLEKPSHDGRVCLEHLLPQGPGRTADHCKRGGSEERWANRWDGREDVLLWSKSKDVTVKIRFDRATVIIWFVRASVRSSLSCFSCFSSSSPGHAAGKATACCYAQSGQASE